MKACFLRFPEGKIKAMTFSYDDGVIEDKKLINLFKKYGVKATFNYNSIHFGEYDKKDALVLPEGHLTAEELKQISADPQFEIACHGHAHPYYATLPQAAATNDIIKNRLELERITGKIIRGFAYPSVSATNDVSETALKAADIAYVRVTSAEPSNSFALPNNWYRWHTTCHHKNATEIFEKFAELKETVAAPYLMYVWGHSFEFERENNWELMENLLEKCHSNPEIWFATNMEIYEYVNAFNRLILSADGTKAYNPTKIDLWAGICTKNVKKAPIPTIKIPAGETVSLLEYLL